MLGSMVLAGVTAGLSREVLKKCNVLNLAVEHNKPWLVSNILFLGAYTLKQLQQAFLHAANNNDIEMIKLLTYKYMHNYFPGDTDNLENEDFSFIHIREGIEIAKKQGNVEIEDYLTQLHEKCAKRNQDFHDLLFLMRQPDSYFVGRSQGGHYPQSSE